MIYTITLNTAVDRTIEVPGLKIGGVFSGRALCEHPAGKGVNVSRCLAALDVESVVGGFVGADDSAYFTSSFLDTRAQARFIPVRGRTRRDTTLIDPLTHTDTHIRETGYSVSRAHLNALQSDLRAQARPTDVVVFCGSLPPGVAPREFADLLKHAQDLECKVAVDTSGDALREAFHARPFLMKPNRAELKMLAPQLSSASSLKEVVTAGRSLLPAVQVLVVSLGKEGALLITSEGDWHALCPLPPESVRSTVGCGDALVAGFLAGIHQNRPLPECLRLGVACGSACALTVVAGLIHRPDVERLLAETRLSRL